MTARAGGRRGLLVAGGLVAMAAGAGLAWWRQQAPGVGSGAAAGGTPSHHGGTDATVAAVGDAAPASLWALRLPRPEGGELVMAERRGKPLLINFWATWCAPCVRELPEFERFHQSHAAKGWQVVGLAIDGPTPVREFLGRVKLSFAIGLAGLEGTELVRQLGNDQGGLPYSVLVGADGRIARRKLGETRLEELLAWAQAS